jgi:transglutaminase-like putative cysteine protease
MKRLLFCLTTLITGFVLQAKDEPLYPVSSIPEDMKTGMYAVIRDQEIRFEINSSKNANTYGRIVITILNQNGNRCAKKVLFHDKFNIIKFFKATAYDAAGKAVNKLKSSEIYDQSVFDGFTLYSDNRLKRADLSRGEYPYTVEFEYEIEHRALLYAPDFSLYDDDEISIQQSKYILAYASGLKPRFKLFKIDGPKVSTYNGKEALEWSFKNIKPQKFEKLSPDFDDVVPNIAVAPSSFEFDKYAGSMDTWDSFAKWIILLNKDRNILPEQTKKHIHELTKNAKSTTEKVRILYEYLQSKTRYVGIQLGIGGYQPFEASIVDQTGYGDCKALSNYMVTLLKEVGIKANYTLIRAGSGEPAIDVTFPSSQFNHVVVAVPNHADTIWLECTSQTNPFGYMGDFTGDRYALMITDEGGKIVKTPSYDADDNTQSRTGDVFVDLTGDAKATVTTTYRGLQYENNNLNSILNNQYDDQKKWIQKNVKIPAFDIASFNMINNKDIIPSAVVKTDLVLKRFATVSGKRIFLTPNLMNKSTYAPEKLDARKSNLVIRKPFTDMDTIRYHLPEGIYPEFIPETVKVQSPFGEYEASYSVDQAKLIYIRKFRMNRGEFPPELYKEFSEFFKNVNKADNTKIVFMSKT